MPADPCNGGNRRLQGRPEPPASSRAVTLEPVAAAVTTPAEAPTSAHSGHVLLSRASAPLAPRGAPDDQTDDSTPPRQGRDDRGQFPCRTLCPRRRGGSSSVDHALRKPPIDRGARLRTQI